MSLARKAFEKAGELGRRVLGTNRGARNKELMEQMRMDRMLPNRAQNLAETVLRTNPASKAIPTGAVPIKNKIISDLLSPKTLLAGTGIAGALKLSTTDPNDLGREMARMNMTLQQGFNTVSQKAIDIAEMPQIYFMEVEKGYKDEMQKQQEMQNIEEFGSPVEPIVLPPEEEGIKPVSLFMAQGGPASPQEMFEALPLPLKDGLKIALDAPSYLVKGSDTAFGPNGEMISDLTDISSYLSRLPQKYNSLLEQKSKAKKMNRRNIGANIFGIPASVVYPEGSTFGDYMRENRANRAKYQKEMELTPGEMIFIDAYESHFKPKKMANVLLICPTTSLDLKIDLLKTKCFLLILQLKTL